jgi:hypothetical protein
MPEAEALVERLLNCQNPDGGWPYSQGTSWAEPTAFGVLALHSEQGSSAISARNRALGWLRSQQKTSGGWSPNPTVAECTSATSVATLALLSDERQSQSLSKNLDSALAWTSAQVYPDNLSFSLLLAKAFHVPPPHAPGSVAWYPGTAGWVTPTALATLVFMRAARQTNRPELRQLAAATSSYLLSRRCPDQGWNHGGSSTRSEDANSYPETTGLALLALRAALVDLPRESVALAMQFSANPESIEGLCWLQLALDSPSRTLPDPPRLPTPRTTRDCSLRLILLRSRESTNVFLPEGRQS